LVLFDADVDLDFGGDSTCVGGSFRFLVASMAFCFCRALLAIGTEACFFADGFEDTPLGDAGRDVFGAC
jgi:hypothetical protein